MNGDPRSHGLWEASAPEALPAPPLTEDLVAEVAIVGAGYTGLSAALHLAEAGASVVVLEGAGIGFGGSGRNVGLVNAGLWLMPSRLRQVLGETHGPRLLSQLGEAPSLVFELIDRHAIDCQPVRSGTLHCAADARGLAELEIRCRQWQELGAPVRLLDPAETAGRLGTTAYRGSLLDLRAGTIQPLAYARGLACAAVSSGARLHSGSPVVAMEEEPGAGWRLRTASGRTLSAKWAIVATNAYTGPGGPCPALQRELVRLPYFNLATAPLPRELAETVLPGREGAWDTRRLLSSFRMDRGGRLVFGSVGALRGCATEVHRTWARRALAKLFPQLAGVSFEHEWYGVIGMTSDAVPRLHALGRRALSISGYNGRGIAPGTTFGRDLARWVLGELTEADMPLPVSEPGSAALKPLREGFYEAGSLAAHLAGAWL
jgi:glycine/D-amino acid oxidase-like deaminating enzyme